MICLACQCSLQRDFLSLPNRYRVTIRAAPEDVLRTDEGKRWRGPPAPRGAIGRFADFVAFESGQLMDPTQQSITSVGCAVPGRNGWYTQADGTPSTAYEGATFFSFPGPCRTVPQAQRDASCRTLQPGGECHSRSALAQGPDGSPHCTWMAEAIGEVRVAELSAVLDAATELERCRTDPAWEYSSATRSYAHDRLIEADAGLEGACFWNGRNSTVRNAERAEALDRLFVQRYPDIPSDMLPPFCDAE